MRYAIFMILSLAVFFSALAVVVSRHESRKLFVEEQALETQRDVMNEDWGRLQIEQATLGEHGRIETLARDRLDMLVPPPNKVVVVRP